MSLIFTFNLKFAFLTIQLLSKRSRLKAFHYCAIKRSASFLFKVKTFCPVSQFVMDDKQMDFRSSSVVADLVERPGGPGHRPILG